MDPLTDEEEAKCVEELRAADEALQAALAKVPFHRASKELVQEAIATFFDTVCGTAQCDTVYFTRLGSTDEYHVNVLVPKQREVDGAVHKLTDAEMLQRLTTLMDALLPATAKLYAESLGRGFDGDSDEPGSLDS